MEPQAFQKALDDLIELNATEGPHTNLFEPKFDARKQADALMVTLKNGLKDSLPVDDTSNNKKGDNDDDDEVAAQKKKEQKALILRNQWQIARLLVFLGNNSHELEDEKDAQAMFLRAAAIAIKCSTQQLLFESQKEFTADLIAPIDLTQLLRMHSAEMTGANHNFYGVQWLLDVLNSLGVFFSARMEARERIGDAICLLHKIEEIYHAFNKWAVASGDTTTIESLPWKSDRSNSDELDLSKVTLSEEDLQQCAAGDEEARNRKLEQLKGQVLRRLKMEQRYTSTIFYLAQGYGLHSDQVNSSKYCFLTMVHQLLCRKDFSRKEWASNAVHLSSFFVAENQFGFAKHCLDAARHLMPTENPSEETLGMVAWGYAKMYKAMLRVGAAHKEQKDGAKEPNFSDFLGPKHSVTNCHLWWRDFPLPVPPPDREMQVPAMFDQARDIFKKGNAECELAAKYYTYETCCPDYIAIHNDIAELYNCLAVFEPALDRRIAMHLRRVELLERFPKEINFDSYTKIVRQTYFDCGDALGDIVEMRHQQRAAYVKECHEAMKKGEPRPKPPHGSSDAALTALVKKAQQMYADFCNTYYDKIAKRMPRKIEKEAHPAFLRAKIRHARLEGKYPCATPQEEYEMVKRMQECYRETNVWAEENEVAKKEPSLEPEVRLSQEMVPVLDGKLREIYRTYSKMTK